MAYRNVDNVNNVIGQLPGVVCGQIITPAFHEQELATEFGLQSFQSAHISAYVFSDRCVGAPSCLDGENAIFWKGLVFYEEFLVFTGEDIVGDGGFFERSSGVFVSKNDSYRTNIILIPQLSAEGKSQCCLSRADRADKKLIAILNRFNTILPSDPNSKSSFFKVTGRVIG